MRALLWGSIAIALFVDGSVSARPHLSKQEVIQIANRKARQVLHYDLREYPIYFVRYFPDKDKWVVNYNHRKWARNWFSVEVFDSTKQAQVWLP